jgi:hypothetical protein
VRTESRRPKLPLGSVSSSVASPPIRLTWRRSSRQHPCSVRSTSSPPTPTSSRTPISARSSPAWRSTTCASCLIRRRRSGAAIIAWRTGLSVLAREEGTALPADLAQAGRGEIAPLPAEAESGVRGTGKGTGLTASLWSDPALELVCAIAEPGSFLSQAARFAHSADERAAHQTRQHQLAHCSATAPGGFPRTGDGYRPFKLAMASRTAAPGKVAQAAGVPPWGKVPRQAASIRTKRPHFKGDRWPG